MNIFFLNEDPDVAAGMLHDKHVVKMVLETAQILSTVSGVGYKPTHQNHPCVLWAGECDANYCWLVKHGVALCAEYMHRYGRSHKSAAVIQQCALARPTVDGPITPPAQAMPEEFRVPGMPVRAYQNYYLHRKVDQSRWTKRDVPQFITEGMNEMAKKQVKPVVASTPVAADAPATLEKPKAPAIGQRGPKGVPLTATITLLAAQNPKRPGSKAFAVFSKYVDGMTVQQFIDAAGDAATPNIVYDAAHGFISVEGYDPKMAEKKVREPKAPKEKKSKKAAAAEDPAESDLEAQEEVIE